MESRTTILDFQLALDRVDKLLEQHEPKHRGAWKYQRIATHLEHSFVHGDDAWDKADFDHNDDKIEENLSSAACRNLMALQLYLEKRRDLQIDEDPKPRPKDA